MQVAGKYEESTSKDRTDSEGSFQMDRCHDCTLLDQRDPNVWNTFVRKRLHEVQEVLKPVNVRHVRSEENPADAATRGHDGMTLKRSSLWWHGPSWLSELRIPHQPKLTKVGSVETHHAKLTRDASVETHHAILLVAGNQ